MGAMGATILCAQSALDEHRGTRTMRGTTAPKHLAASPPVPHMMCDTQYSQLTPRPNQRQMPPALGTALSFRGTLRTNQWSGLRTTPRHAKERTSEVF
jgi:hypothetical protein